jgi:hypothetical protein
MEASFSVVVRGIPVGDPHLMLAPPFGGVSGSKVCLAS